LNRGEHETVYAPGYTESGLRQVREGMPESEVRAILGDPLFKWGSTWNYADQATSHGDYFFRQVVVENGVVVGKRTGFYLD